MTTKCRSHLVATRKDTLIMGFRSGHIQKALGKEETHKSDTAKKISSSMKQAIKSAQDRVENGDGFKAFFDIEWISVFLGKASCYTQWLTMMQFGLDTLLRWPDVLFALIAQGVTEYDVGLHEALEDLGLRFVRAEEGKED